MQALVLVCWMRAWYAKEKSTLRPIGRLIPPPAKMLLKPSDCAAPESGRVLFLANPALAWTLHARPIDLFAEALT